ncbi:hypothetical protein F4821DRAFT_230487 [Hypoxylon rubiginosum]|uniref:Uncharacterized protein n=1 Tax=Hypoxylon rubiginosum TaxID=110542 RepID=A0ACC0DBK1_9PEZI|nr:hypothetical protein F4821DRAFT_230487 [Hypoxylon rubiginosum]
MLYYRYQLWSSLLASWLVLTPCWSSAAQSPIEFPATVDVELIFPRNDTYAPANIVPIVFAIRNSQLAAPLDLSFDWNLWNLDNLSAPGAGGLFDLTNVNFSNVSDPYFAYEYVTELNVTEARWSLVWSMGSGNCSRPDGATGDDKTASSLSFYNRDRNVRFTTRNGAQQPDLAAAATTDADACTDNYFTFNVTGVLDTPLGAKYDGRETCAVLAPTNMSATPTEKLCGFGADASAVSSILAGITATACSSLHPVISCPPDAPSGASAGKGMSFLVTRIAWLEVAVLVGLLFC